jgi:GT2 family glycosyltransferase
MNFTTQSNPITFCISTYNNLEYLKLAVESVRKNSFYSNAPFIIHAENCTDGTDQWLKSNKYNLEYYIEKNTNLIGIGGGMNFCAEKVTTKYIMFLHSDFYVGHNWDLSCLEEIQKHNEPTWVFSHRIEPDMFGNGQSRPGTIIVSKDTFGAYYDEFDKEILEDWMDQFVRSNNFTIPKAEGVSGLICKSDWDKIGGNDPQFSPTSWEDMDLFLRMKNEGYKFVLTSKSMVFHFGARGSHRLEENNGKSDQRQITYERENAIKFYNKWKGTPKFDEYGMISGINKIKQTPIIILNRDRFHPLVEQVNVLKSKGYDNIIIIDNQSTYEPLLEWYKTSGVDVFHNDIVPNSHLAFKDLINAGHPKFTALLNDWYVYNDGDIIPMNDIPDTFIDDLIYFAKKYNKTKVGMSIKIDDIDRSYPLNEWVYGYESTYWTNGILDESGVELYPHPIDTTFAVHAPGTMPEWSNNTLRVGVPYVVKHAPFYYNPEALPEDEKYYLEHMNKNSSNWSSKVEIK